MPDDSTRLRAALLVSGTSVDAWQAHAIRHSADLLDVRAVLVAAPAGRPNRRLRNLIYFVSRATFLRSALERAVAVTEVAESTVPRIAFTPVPDGAWQRLPEGLREELEAHEVDVVIRLGMGLIRNPDSTGVRHGILSFHHGDPALFRGRPAGFYELLHGSPTVGTIVQRLSDRLDAGTILAIGWNRTIPTSYRRTMDAVYRDSRHVLRAALVALMRDDRVDHATDGPITTLPRNTVTIRFVLRTLRARIGRLLYGATVRKAWKVGVTDTFDLDRPGPQRLTVRRTFSTPPDARFLADPMAAPDGGLLAESLDRRSGLGTIVRLSDDGPATRLSLIGVHGHVSYPFTFQHAGGDYLLPEMADSGPQRIFTLDGARSFPLRGLEQARLIDPTLHHDGATWWLFAGKPGSEFDLLWLWNAPDPFGPFTPHPLNPIVQDPRRARPAGRLVTTPQGLLRPGQNGTGRYGDGLTLSVIERLDMQDYRERPVATVALRGFRGPHTLDVRNDRTIVDLYVDRISPFAAFDRVRSRLAARGAAGRA